MLLEPHWRRLNRALDHIDALDRSIKKWLDSDAYRIVKEHYPQARRTVYVARISGEVPPDWPDLIGDAVHCLRSALDRLAFALSAKGYADTHNGAAIPSEREAESTFPIFGNINQRGMPMDGEQAFRSSASHRLMPSGAIAVIEDLQPYKRRKDFRRDPLWAIHELSRVDKHRIDVDLAATAPETVRHFSSKGLVHAGLGASGPVYDGKELSQWTVGEGYKEPDIQIHFARTVAFGNTTPVRDQPVVPTLRGIRNYIRYRVAFQLDKFL